MSSDVAAGISTMSSDVAAGISTMSSDVAVETRDLDNVI